MSILTLAKLYYPIEKDLNQIKNLMLEHFSETQSKELERVVNHISNATGKMVRAACCQFAYNCGSNTDDKNKLYLLGSVIETIHLASLVHDDIIDKSEMRRNQPSIYKQFGADTALVSGTFFYAKALKHISEIGSLEILEDISFCVQRLCEGELNQIRDIKTCSIEQYLESINGKTSVLFESACKNAALLSQGPVEQLSNYGKHLGTIFQMTDDYLDIFGKEKDLSKNTGQDFDAGVVSLPYILLFNKLNDNQQDHYLNCNSLNDLKHSFKNELNDVKSEMKMYINSYVEKAHDCLREIATKQSTPLKDIIKLIESRIH